MDNTNKTRTNHVKIHIAAMFIPFIINIAAIKKNSVFLYIVAFISIFIYIFIMPGCRKRENLWGFVLIATDYLPVNIYLIILTLNELKGVDKFFDFYLFFLGIIYFLILFSMEQLAVGFIIKFIFRKQKKLWFTE